MDNSFFDVINENFYIYIFFDEYLISWIDLLNEEIYKNCCLIKKRYDKSILFCIICIVLNEVVNRWIYNELLIFELY